jgi:excisionase family DNA binding protein
MRPLLTQREVCKLLGFCSKTVKKLRQSGKLPFVKLGYRSIRFRQEDVGAFVNRRFGR